MDYKKKFEDAVEKFPYELTSTGDVYDYPDDETYEEGYEFDGPRLFGFYINAVIDMRIEEDRIWGEISLYWYGEKLKIGSEYAYVHASFEDDHWWFSVESF